MPIGENAIKRVENNGYSKVQTSCPDMENSEIALPAEPAPAPKSAPKKTVQAKSAAIQSAKEGFVRVSLGDDMPYWLL